MMFDQVVQVRLTLEQLREARRLSNNDKYENVSHVLRTALIKLIREETGKKQFKTK